MSSIRDFLARNSKNEFAVSWWLRLELATTDEEREAVQREMFAWAEHVIELISPWRDALLRAAETKTRTN